MVSEMPQPVLNITPEAVDRLHQKLKPLINGWLREEVPNHPPVTIEFDLALLVPKDPADADIPARTAEVKPTDPLATTAVDATAGSAGGEQAGSIDATMDAPAEGPGATSSIDVQ